MRRVLVKGRIKQIASRLPAAAPPARRGGARPGRAHRVGGRVHLVHLLPGATRHYEVAVAADGSSAPHQAAAWHPDLIVLDLGLPDLDGVDVIHGLRGWTRTPVVVLSGRAGNQDKIDVLDAGADDHVTKPFGIEDFLDLGYRSTP